MQRILCLYILTISSAFTSEIAYPVVGTGQSKCYDDRSEIAPPQPGQPFYGQDAQQHSFRSSYAPSADGLTVQDKITGLTWQRSPDTNGDGTVTDRATGLMWPKADSGTGMNWRDALARVQKMNAEKFLGHGDWRLPNVKELQSIVDYTRSPDTSGTAAIDPVFHCTTITNEDGKADFPFYWSATTHAGLHGGGAAMYVALGQAAGWMSPRAQAGGPPPERPGGPGFPPGPPPQQGNEAGPYHFVDVHGAGSQRSDPKSGDPAMFPHGRGPQGDVIRINNFVRVVRNAAVSRPP